jgi:hypothetical protein
VCISMVIYCLELMCKLCSFFELNWLMIKYSMFCLCS